MLYYTSKSRVLVSNSHEGLGEGVDAVFDMLRLLYAIHISLVTQLVLLEVQVTSLLLGQAKESSGESVGRH